MSRRRTSREEVKQTSRDWEALKRKVAADPYHGLKVGDKVKGHDHGVYDAEVKDLFMEGKTGKARIVENGVEMTVWAWCIEKK